MFPQPVNEKLNFVIRSQNEGTAIIAISDITGKIIIKQTQSLVSGTQTIEVNTGKLLPGSYIIMITDHTNKLATAKFIKK